MKTRNLGIYGVIAGIMVIAAATWAGDADNILQKAYNTVIANNGPPNSCKGMVLNKKCAYDLWAQLRGYAAAVKPIAPLIDHYYVRDMIIDVEIIDDPQVAPGYPKKQCVAQKSLPQECDPGDVVITRSGFYLQKGTLSALPVSVSGTFSDGKNFCLGGEHPTVEEYKVGDQVVRRSWCASNAGLIPAGYTKADWPK